MQSVSDPSLPSTSIVKHGSLDRQQTFSHKRITPLLRLIISSNPVAFAALVGTADFVRAESDEQNSLCR